MLRFARNDDLHAVSATKQLDGQITKSLSSHLAKNIPLNLLGDDTAPNPSEASLAALGSCLAVGLHANAVHRGWTVNKLELELEGDLNITAVWGTGDVSEKPVGFTDVRVKVDMECEGVPKSEIDALVTHVKKWSPVANTFTRPVNLEVSI